MSDLSFCLYMCTYSLMKDVFVCTSRVSDVRAMAVSINFIVSNVSTVMSLINCIVL